MSGVESRGMPAQKPHAGGKDFSKGKIWSNIMVQAVPLILAQLVQLLYNVVDRIYIGHLPERTVLLLQVWGLHFHLQRLSLHSRICSGWAAHRCFP